MVPSGRSGHANVLDETSIAHFGAGVTGLSTAFDKRWLPSVDEVVNGRMDVYSRVDAFIYSCRNFLCGISI